MIVSHLELRSWRSYPSLSLDFANKVNVIEGSNGSGKTNLAEAIYYLSFARSWRSDDDGPLIKQGESQAYLQASLQEGELHRSVEIELSRSSKRIKVNDKPIHRLSELSKLTNIILFAPTDTTLFTGSPSCRRNFLDVSLSKSSLDYLSLISSYSHLLSERNASLKSPNPDKKYLSVVTEEMIALEEPIERYRSEYVEGLNQTLAPLVSCLYGSKRVAKLVYKPFLPLNDKFTDEARKAYEKCLENDLFRKSTSIGPQREDFSLLLDDKDIGVYGSQGENRLAAIALKLSPYYLIQEESKKPIAVLDDIYSELDEFHSKALDELVGTLGQCFITAAKLKINGASYIEVADHNAKRRN
jgi:DNA replication and repair protein RecF